MRSYHIMQADTTYQALVLRFSKFVRYTGFMPYVGLFVLRDRFLALVALLLALVVLRLTLLVLFLVLLVGPLGHIEPTKKTRSSEGA